MKVKLTFSKLHNKQCVVIQLVVVQQWC